MRIRNRRQLGRSVVEQLEARRLLTTTPIWTPPEIIETGIDLIYAEGADITRNGLDDVLAASSNVRFYANSRDSGLAEPIELTSDGSGYSMTLARDLDGDNDLDVVASSSARGVVVIMNNGDGTWAPDQLITSFGGIQRIQTADIDGDGDLDVVSASYTGGSGRLAWHANRGDGTFDPETVINPSASGLFSLAVADLDGDDRPELVTAEFGETDPIAVYRNTPTGFQREAITNTLNAPLAVEVADLDGDGDEDVIAGGYYSNDIVWFENDGAAQFSQNANAQITDNVGGPFRIRNADWDKDGDLDLISVSTGDDKVAFHENLGGGEFAAQVVLFDNWSGPTAGSPADLDGDGDEDLLVASYADDTLLWVRNDTVRPAERFGEPNVISSGVSAVFVVDAIDLDGDGSNDMLAAATGSNQVVWAPNDGNGGFGAVQTIGTQAGSPLFAGAADLDGDGDNDVFSTSSFAADEIIWYENLGGGVFGPENIIETGLGQPRWLEAGDADGDGDLDLFAATNDDNRYFWYENRLNEPTADFVVGQVISDGPGAGANKLIPIDMDGDGDLDAFAASSTPANPTPISWYENDGTGNFFTENVIAPATVSRWYARPADLDGDGDIDVAATSFVGALVWFENLGGGSWSDEQVISTAPEGSYGLDVADLDGDGDNDLVTGSYYDNEVAWYENNGDGSFTGQQVLSRSQSGPFSVIAADIDGDGDEDVLAGSYYDDTVAWYENSPAVEEEPLLPTIDKYVTTEHLDLSFNFQSGQWVASVDVDKLDGSTVFYDPDEAIIYAGPNTQTTRQEGSEWDFIGIEAGDPLWVLPQRRMEGMPWPGFAVDRTDSGTFARYFEGDPRVNRENDWVKFELVDMRGPEGAEFGTYTAVGTTTPVIGSWMSTADGISPVDAFWQREGGHSHLNFYFTEPGVYEVDLKASGFIDVNGNRVFDPGLDVFSESEPSTFYFAVETPNAAPTVTTPTTIDIAVGDSLSLSGDSQIVVEDTERSSGDYQVTLNAIGGVVSLVPDGVTLTNGDGSQDGQVTLVGPLAAVNATLATLEFRAGPGAGPNTRIDIDVNDGGFFQPDFDEDGVLDNAATATAAVLFNVTGSPLTPGDANGDGAVDLLDLDILGASFGTNDGASFFDADFNDDGAVDLLDLDILGSNFGAELSSEVTSSATAADVPLAQPAVSTRVTYRASARATIGAQSTAASIARDNALALAVEDLGAVGATSRAGEDGFARLVDSAEAREDDEDEIDSSEASRFRSIDEALANGLA